MAVSSFPLQLFLRNSIAFGDSYGKLEVFGCVGTAISEHCQAMRCDRVRVLTCSFTSQVVARGSPSTWEW